MRSAGQPAVLGQFRHRGLPAGAHSDGGRNRGEGLARREDGEPLVISVGRPAQGQRQAGLFFGQIPSPGAVVLYLPGQPEAVIPGGQHSRGQRSAGRPGAQNAGAVSTLRGQPARDRGEGGQIVAYRPPLPAVLATPVVRAADQIKIIRPDRYATYLPCDGQRQRRHCAK